MPNRLLFALSLNVKQFYITHLDTVRCYHFGVSGPGSDGNKGVFFILTLFRTGSSPSYLV